ncbi:MAG: glycine cleavage system aminomethyltransferase GcvT [Ectothiorhodospiraceae bacterium]|nr:glycine cleavage system aminomethyltransferase GcvT [Chromatiales bacterium]MCP5153642.1 glycine cleavage system aminomethyltransferase GcvT [Ectothiorhodospiraceae bacterium]
MSDSPSPRPGRTVLHAWHVAAGGRMVEFGGYEMPVQYKTGIIAEHLATRRHAGLFDVSHMGRLRFSGPRAEAVLLHLLTNDAAALRPGEAQYTFLADEHGGAVDDAYLYRLADEAFLLVVNASNRARDLAWIAEHTPPGDGCEMVDESERVAMISLQGPHSAGILTEVLGASALPEPKRNRLTTVRIDDAEVVVARTGYTGESICFELFPPAERAVALWERLVAAGAVPVGLGARDSLRLEAGLPLYGHELGTDPDGDPIPVFANGLARFAVRANGTVPFVGQAALEHQREEAVALRRGEDDLLPSARALPRLVQPIAAFTGRRPLRAGYRVEHEGRDVGFVTSGTTVPATRFYGEGITAVPADEHDLRPIGLALIDASLRYRSDRPVVLEVVDARGARMDVELVERNLWPAAPYARAYRGFEPAPTPARVDGDPRWLAAALAASAEDNHRWRRTQCINLIPSEQCVSPFVERLCATDPAGRYNEHNRVRALGPSAPEVRYYKGTAWIMEQEEALVASLREHFQCTRAEVRVISGQMANDVVYDALKQFRNRHRPGRPSEPIARVLVHDLNKGGHLSAQVAGALKNYVAADPRTGRPAVEHFPFEPGCPQRIDVAATKALIAQTRPELVVFGRSVIVHREPVAEIVDFVHEHFGRDDPRRPFVMYDGAHVLGLLGPAFQDPLAEGADIVTGSTHKTYLGPQRGVILSNIGPGSCFEELWRHIESRAFPGHVSNHHLGTLLGLLGATYEMLAFRDTYPHQVVANARAFAAGLAAQGLVLEGDPALGYTETHQVLLRGARARGDLLASLLEANNVITNPQAFHDDPSFAAASGVRMGTQEMTRFGMEPADFTALADLVAEIVREGEHRPAGHWRERVAALRGRFLEMRYCLE